MHNYSYDLSSLQFIFYQEREEKCHPISSFPDQEPKHLFPGWLNYLSKNGRNLFFVCITEKGIIFFTFLAIKVTKISFQKEQGRWKTMNEKIRPMNLILFLYNTLSVSLNVFILISSDIDNLYILWVFFTFISPNNDYI